VHHVTVLRNALAQLPVHRAGTRPGRKVLIRIDGAGCTHELLDWIVGQRMSYSVGFTLPTDFAAQLTKIPRKVWTSAYNSDGEIRDGAWVAEITGLLKLDSWPAGMRVIAGKERPHPGAQLRITDADGLRVTAFATNSGPGGPDRQLADLELRHRRRARAADRIRNAKGTGLTNLPPDGGNPNAYAYGCSPSPPAWPDRTPNRAAPGHSRALDRAARRGPQPRCAHWPNPADPRPPAPTTISSRSVEPATQRSAIGQTVILTHQNQHPRPANDR
jgi:hypothetical protein